MTGFDDFKKFEKDGWEEHASTYGSINYQKKKFIYSSSYWQILSVY